MVEISELDVWHFPWTHSMGRYFENSVKRDHLGEDCQLRRRNVSQSAGVGVDNSQMEERKGRKNVKVTYNHSKLGNKIQPGESRERRERVLLALFGSTDVQSTRPGSVS